MNDKQLIQKRDRYQADLKRIPEYTLQTFEQAFEIEYTHNSTAIEGNTLTLIETKVLLEDGISIGGKHLRELYEAVNHRNAYRYVKECIEKGAPLSEKLVKDIHAILMDHIFIGGIYRNMDVYISGAQHTPPSPAEMYRQIKNFYSDLSWKGNELNLIELAAWTHAEFVRIHPFPDGNGRTSRLIMNYQLLANGFPAVSIAKENRLEYFDTLEAYAVKGDLAPFAEMVAALVDRQMDRYLAMGQPAQEMDQRQEE
ncbi:MAG TPA: Fic family protein [Candidatus Eisenbergiella merdavium]|uniref:Fic family protein n=1 Tax=Candidatus Eisenbergiella merdavium TaxID=2838551 RepID=A0A9D2NF64_9FIRM|nr:Fic family protein [Candidatus Eisenbergiella merdavium]